MLPKHFYLSLPYSKSCATDPQKAIIAANLGVDPTSDGEVIRIAVPALTEERQGA